MIRLVHIPLGIVTFSAVCFVFALMLLKQKKRKAFLSPKEPKNHSPQPQGDSDFSALRSAFCDREESLVVLVKQL